MRDYQRENAEQHDQNDRNRDHYAVTLRRVFWQAVLRGKQTQSRTVTKNAPPATPLTAFRRGTRKVGRILNQAAKTMNGEGCPGSKQEHSLRSLDSLGAEDFHEAMPWGFTLAKQREQSPVPCSSPGRETPCPTKLTPQSKSPISPAR